MSRELIQTEKEILGLFYLLDNIKNDYSEYFSISNEEACKEIETLTQDFGRKISLRSFRRILSFETAPFISKGKMNDLTSWFTKGDCNLFSKYIIKNEKEIIKFSLNKNYKIDIIIKKIELHKSKKNVSITNKTIKISDINKHIKNKYLNNPTFNSIRINGDINNSIGYLKMKEYYIQLSYIAFEDTFNRDSLLKLEKKHPYVELKSKSYYYRNLSQDYISNTVLNNKRVVISGNPGVGKSTYAKWLCYNWAKTYKKNQKIIIYIQLRDLNFNRENYLSNYIDEYYFSDLEMEGFSLKSLDNFQLILDGFDEITYKNRLKLSKKIKIHDYIILSRPYGLIHHNLNYDLSIQIDGFNDVCINLYLSKVINNKKSKQQLVKLIEKNRVLQDYASIPLMLSYIVLIFLTSENVKTDLTAIKSIYDLQEKVFSWILDYGIKKESIKKKDLSKIIHQITKFAYIIQINKKFTYIGNDDDEYLGTVKKLSAIGLGSQKPLSKNSFQWQFSFNTVTFQEFLAAKYLDTKNLNVEAIVYLVKDSFFWNFCIMIVGMLSVEKKVSIHRSTHPNLLIQVLQFLQNFYVKNKQQYYGYAYYMLLAESNEYIVNQIIKKEDLELTISFYEKAYFDNFWSLVIHDSIKKIVYKLTYQKKNIFIKILTNQLVKINEVIKTRKIQDKNFYYLTNLLEIGYEYETEKILKSLIPVLMKLKNQISVLSNEVELFEQQNIKEQSYDEKIIDAYYEIAGIELWGRDTLSAFINDFENLNYQELLPYKKEIIQIYFEELTTIDIFENIIIPITTIPDLNKIKKQCKEIIEGNDKTIKRKDKQNIYFENLFKHTEDILHLITKKNISINNLDLIIASLTFQINDLNTNNYSFISDAFLGKYTDLLFGCLIKINKPKLYDLLFSIMEKFEITDISRMPNETALINYTEKIFNTIFEKLDLKLLKKIILVLESTSCVNNNFFYFRDKIFYVLKELIEKNKKILSKENITDNQYIEITSLIQKLVNIPKESYEKKYILNKLLDSNLISENYLFQKDILIAIMSNFIFYEEKYWKILTEYFQKNNWNAEIVIPIINNENLFLVTTNHPHILRIFIETFKKEINLSEELLASNGGEILEITVYILMLLKNHDGKEKHTVLNIIEQLFKKQIMISYCNTYVDDLTTPSYSLAYILFYFFNPELKDVLIDIDFNELFSIEPGAKNMIFDTLIKFTENPYYGIEIQEINKFKLVLGDKLHQELIDLIDQRLINKNEFNDEHFKMLLNLKDSNKINLHFK